VSEAISNVDQFMQNKIFLEIPCLEMFFSVDFFTTSTTNPTVLSPTAIAIENFSLKFYRFFFDVK